MNASQQQDLATYTASDRVATEAAPEQTPEDAAHRSELSRRLDALSLAQALLDFEVANARVLDLTARLVEANQRVQRVQADADAARTATQHAATDTQQLREALAAARDETAAIRASRGYRAITRLAAVRRALRG